DDTRLPGNCSSDGSPKTGRDEATEDRPERRPQGVRVPDVPRVEPRGHPVEAEDVEHAGDADRDRPDHQHPPARPSAQDAAPRAPDTREVAGDDPTEEQASQGRAPQEPREVRPDDSNAGL